MKGFDVSREEFAKAMKDKLPKSFITIGIHESKNVKPADSNQTIAEYAAENHFGKGRIPARPFLDVGVLSVRGKLQRAIEDAFDRNVPDDVLWNRVGAIAVAGVKKYIRDLKYPPNAPMTIQQKGSSNPLIDKGNMINAIDFEVHS